MVNTRKKSYVPSADDAGAQSDSSSTSTSVRRSTRASLGNTQLVNPEAVATPPRRSRRLSNSSVESVSTNVNGDTPNPVGPHTRRSSRGKAASADSDVELLVIKRRKLAEPVENLGPITEEKPEGDGSDIPTKLEVVELEAPILIEQDGLSDEKVKETTDATSPKQEDKLLEGDQSTPRIGELEEAKPNLTTNRLSADICVLSDGDKQDTCKEKDKKEKPQEEQPVVQLDTEDRNLAPEPEKVEEIVSSNQDAVEENSAKEHESEAEEEYLTPEPEVAPFLKEAATQSEGVEQPAPQSQESIKSEITAAQEVGTAETNQPASSASVSERLLKLAESSSVVTKKNTSQNAKKVSEKPKPTLPCGADILRNIPRGKCKSGREWKAPKSNPRYLYQDKGLKMPFEKITQLRLERQRVKELENRLKEEERARRAELARRKEINKKREEENARRGEVVQVIRNTNKIKRMKKKQLKLIQKRDTTMV